jgi:hypothetical protein
MQVIFNKSFKHCFPFPRWADSTLYKINNTVMPILLAGTIEFVQNELVSALDKFYYIKVDLGGIGWGDVDWIGAAKDRDRWRALVNAVMNLRVP